MLILTLVSQEVPPLLTFSWLMFAYRPVLLTVTCSMPPPPNNILAKVYFSVPCLHSYY